MCLFCNIIQKNIPASIVYEDEVVLAILDVFPATEGHTLIMPKKHVENFLEADQETLNHINKITQDLAKQYLNKLSCHGYNVITNCGTVSGQTINHLHFHLVPRYGQDDNFGFKTITQEIQDVSKTLEKLK